MSTVKKVWNVVSTVLVALVVLLALLLVGARVFGLQNFQISVVAEAIQAEGFTDADAAWEAFSKQA